MNTLHRGVPEHGAANLSALVMHQEDAIGFENPGKIGRDLGGREGAQMPRTARNILVSCREASWKVLLITLRVCESSRNLAWMSWFGRPSHSPRSIVHADF
jgi:hypothetical protein